MEPPLQPKHRPEDHEIPDGMRLLYADLRPRPEPPPQDRARVDLLIGGLVAAAGVVTVGPRVIADLVRSARSDEAAATIAASFTGSGAGATGSHDVVMGDTAPVVSLARVAAPEIEYGPPAEPMSGGFGDIAVVNPTPLPGPGVPARTVAPPAPVSPRPGAPPLEPIRPVEPREPDPPVTTTTTAPGAPGTTTTTAPPGAPGTTTTAPPDAPATTTTAPPDAPKTEVWAFAASLGFSTTPGMEAVIAESGVAGWVAAQLDPDTVLDPIVDEALAGFDLLNEDAVDLRARGLAEVALSQSRWAAFTRGYVGERQVQEALVAMWREFFAVRGDAADELAHDQAIRRHALGRFDDFLVEMVKSPARLRATGGDRVDGSAPGRQPTGLARVVLELLTVGCEVASEAEVIAVTEVLSGWSVDGTGRFVFDDSRHARSPARILGWETPGRSGSAGFDDGRNLLAHLARRGETADKVATMIAMRLLGEGASRGLIQRAARAYTAADTSLAAVIRVVLADAPTAAGVTGRRGREWVTAAMQALRVTADISRPWDTRIVDSLPAQLRAVGDEPGDETSRLGRDPKLWWESPRAVSRRWAVARRLTAPGPDSGLTVDLRWLRPDEAMAADEFVAGLAERFGARLTGREHDALLAYIGVEGDDGVGGVDGDDGIDGVTVDDSLLADLAALVVSFPSFMRRDGGA